MLKIVFFVLCASVYYVDAGPEKAVVVLKNANNTIKGVVTFEETIDGVLINGNISGLKEGFHGFHIHDRGNFTGSNCSSAGAHFNPLNRTHGSQSDGPDDRHVGDLGNIVADTKGIADISLTDKIISLKDGKENIIGKILIVHADKDDNGRGEAVDSSTTGHSGERLACGVIERSGSAFHRISMLVVIFAPVLAYLNRL